MIDWYQPLRGLKSRGSQARRPGSLAGLHTARKEHLGQFFTPDALAGYMFRLVEDELNKVVDVERGHKASVLDTSVGSGRLLQFCDPARHIVGGSDVDPEAISAVQQVFEAAGFECTFLEAGMETLRASRWSLCLLNPPFSVHLDSPLLQPYGCTAYGKFGPNTSAQSDYYALAQALDAASVVVALVPRTVAQKVWDEPELVDLTCLAGRDIEDASKQFTRLHARLDLPSGSFKDEGAVVEVSILVFGYTKVMQRDRLLRSLGYLEEVVKIGDLGLNRSDSPTLKVKGLDHESASITLPVTGDKTVRVGHDGRKIRLKFKCGFTQARVMNAVLDHRIYSTDVHRLPKGYKHAGQGKLDIQVHLLQEDPEASLRELFDEIEQQDAELVIDKGLWPYFRKSVRRNKLASAPMGHHVWKQGEGLATVKARCKKGVILDKSSWLSPVIKAGEVVVFTRTQEDRFVTQVKGTPYCVNFEELDENFESVGERVESSWVEVSKPLQQLHPQLAAWWLQRFYKSVVSKFLTWNFQVFDVCELLMCPRGAVVAWTMGLGKSRLAVALILLSGVKRGLVTTEAYLVPEFVEQLEKLNLPAETWKVIKSEADLADLRTINIISNERLRMELSDSKRVTYAHKLRRRIGMAVSDEGEFMSNPTSSQSRALKRVSAQKRFLLSGTPLANYPRDALPLICYVGGDATAAQPWGYYGPYLEANHRKSVEFADRGISKFIDSFVDFVWITNEFSDSLRDGAKREIPRIKSLQAYRAMLAPHIKRRVIEEPDVSPYVKIPKAKKIVHTLDFDEDHLGHYLTVSEEFQQWFSSDDRKNKSLMLILMRFQAVLRALNLPQMPAKHVNSIYSGVTSKQRFLVDRMEVLAKMGEKTMCYVHSPDLAILLANRLKVQTGIDPVVLHGKITAAKRHKLLRERFKLGDCPTAIATYGVTQSGHNIPQISRVIMGSRDWTAKVEQQSIARALRPETDHDVTVEYVHIGGSSDDYQDQLVAFKADAISSGLDWGTPEMDGRDFVHMDTLLGRFCTALAERKGMKLGEFQKMIKACA